MTADDSRAAAPNRVPELDEATRTALGSLSEALETVERARGHLYAFHQLCGTADFTLERTVHDELAGGSRHTHEAALKESRRTPGHRTTTPHHPVVPEGHHVDIVPLGPGGLTPVTSVR